MQSLELPLSLAQETGIGHGVPLGVRVELLQAYINPYLRTCAHMRHLALGLHHNLHIIAICPLEQAHALDSLRGEGRYGLFCVANQAQATNLAAITEGEVFAVSIDFPAGLFLLH